MALNVTAIYRTREVADLVRRGLEDIGIPRHDIHIVPDPAHDTATGRAAESGSTDVRTSGNAAGAAPAGTSAAGASAGEHPLHGRGALTDPAYTDRLHELHLPEEDVRTYQHSIRRGDYVVSAEVDQDKVDRAKAIMRRPETETYDVEHRASEFRNEPIVPHSAGEGHMLNEEMRARRIAAGDDRYYRTYERNRRLENIGRI